MRSLSYARALIGASLSMIAGYGFAIPAVPPPTLYAPSVGRMKSRRGYTNNPRGTVPNRGLKRIRGRDSH